MISKITMKHTDFLNEKQCVFVYKEISEIPQANRNDIINSRARSVLSYTGYRD